MMERSVKISNETKNEVRERIKEEKCEFGLFETMFSGEI